MRKNRVSYKLTLFDIRFSVLFIRECKLKKPKPITALVRRHVIVFKKALDEKDRILRILRTG